MANPLLDSTVSNLEKFAGGAISSLIGGPLSSHFSRKMMDYQDKLNDQNALDAYNRQRQLLGDAASIQKAGMLKAGYNTAFGSNGSVMSVGNQSALSTGLAPVVSNMMPNSFQTVLDAKKIDSDSKVADAQSAFYRSQTQSQDIKNTFEIDRQIEEVEQLHKQNKISDAEYNTRIENLNRLKDTHDSFVTQETEKAKQSEIQTQISDIQRQQEAIKIEILGVTKSMSEEQLKQAKFVTEHQLERFIKDMQEQDSRIAANKASATASYASAAASRAQALYTGTLNELEKAKIPYADRIARATAKSAENAALSSYYQFRTNKAGAEHVEFETKRDKEFHSGDSYSYYAGEVMRNLLAGWLPFSSSASVSKKLP